MKHTMRHEERNGFTEFRTGARVRHELGCDSVGHMMSALLPSGCRKGSMENLDTLQIFHNRDFALKACIPWHIRTPVFSTVTAKPTTS